VSCDRKVTMAEVAREAGVGVMTVSRVLRGGGGVSDKLAARVRHAVDKLGYISNDLAGGLSSRTSRAIVVVVPSFAEPTVSSVVDAISRKVSEQRYQVLLANTHYDKENEISVLRQCLGWQPAGIILWGFDHNPNIKNLIRANRTPTVEIWSVEDDIIDCAIGFSHLDAGLLITQHIIDRGANMPAFVRGAYTDVRSIEQRERGFRNALLARQMLEPHVIVPESGPLSMAHGGAVVERVLNEKSGVDALIFGGEAAAVGAVLKCQQLGVDVPKDIMIAGFGNSELMRMVTPSITSVATDIEELASVSVRQLLERIEGRLSPGFREYLPVEVHARQSTRR